MIISNQPVNADRLAVVALGVLAAAAFGRSIGIAAAGSATSGVIPLAVIGGLVGNAAWKRSVGTA